MRKNLTAFAVTSLAILAAIVLGDHEQTVHGQARLRFRGGSWGKRWLGSYRTL
jgi:hypothetical protein